MPKRYSPTERLGVNETERIVLKELVWIFREQPIVDVGIDALIEQVKDGNPTGKFLAVQIKTGESHFSLSKEKLIFYPTDVHYNYWLSTDIPMILVDHIPEREETYWQYISRDNIQKTKKGGWKIEIPKKQELNKNAKRELSRILSKKGKRNIIVDLYKGEMTSESVFNANENIDFMKETSICINNIREIAETFRLKHLEFYGNFEKSFEINSLELKIYKIKSIINVFAKKIDIYSERLEREVFLYSKCHAIATYACEHATLFNYLLSRNKVELESIIISLTEEHDSTKDSLTFVESIKVNELNLPDEHPVLKLLTLQVIRKMTNDLVLLI
ncbi:MAG: DUF4365 domain-containing protein [Candidatus Electrothrix sp. ATG2]|nr:DUF4365 domain-containing protein [Candidatus Electrothrix sp. ATG2]